MNEFHRLEDYAHVGGAVSHSGAIAVDLRHVVYSLSDAVDLVGVDDVGHGKRVGAMAAYCGDVMGLNEEQSTFLFDLGMLHDIGVSSTSVHGHLVNEFDWSGSQLHCVVGYNLLCDFAPLSHLALPIRYHHTKWENLVEMSELDHSVKSQANLIFLVDRVDALAAPYYTDGSLLMHTAEIRRHIQQFSGTFFAPELVEAFLAASKSEAFWLQLEPRGIQAVLQDMLDLHQARQATFSELKQLGEIFSKIVDAKSPFTAEHSLGVSRMSRYLAERMHVSAENCDKIEISGLLHDLGKLRVPDEVLDKPGTLDENERKIISAHSFETFQVLRHIKGFEEITAWAAYHHEEPDGTGYPFHVNGRDLPLEARILRVADIFQAMVQDRPYRKGLDANEIRIFLEDLVAKQRAEIEIVAEILADIPKAMAVALAKHQT